MSDTLAYIGLGANLGDRRANLTHAVAALAGCGDIEAISSVYTSEPVGYPDQPWFWNLVLRLRTRLGAQALLAAGKRIERALGRRPTPRNHPRPIDVDLLLYGEQVIRTPELVVPHAALSERAFVLRPLVEIEPALVHPATGERLADRLGTTRGQRTRRLFDGWALLRGVLSLLLAVAVLACGRDDPDRRAREIAALVDSLMPRLERLSGLNARDSVRVELRTPAEVRRYVERRLDEELPADELHRIRAVYAMLGLVPDTMALRDLLMDLYTEQIAGYYDPATRALHVVQSATAPAVRPVIAHELVHALQDQHANLDSLIDRSRGNDRQMAAQAAIEGHATMVMFALLAEDAAGGPVDAAFLPDPGVQLRAAFESADSDFPVFRTAPAIIRETLLFPYVAGASFVRRIWSNGLMKPAPTAPLGPWLPQSTEQVMDPDGRFAPVRDEPIELRFDTVPAWRAVYENTLGAFETRFLLETHLGPAVVAAAGWGGDRYVLLERADGAHALVWVSAWDEQGSAHAFAVALQAVLDRGALAGTGRIDRLRISGHEAVRLVLAQGEDAAAIPPPDVYCADEFGRRAGCRTADRGSPPTPRP